MGRKLHAQLNVINSLMPSERKLNVLPHPVPNNGYKRPKVFFVIHLGDFN